MANFDWHAERSNRQPLDLVGTSEMDGEIDLVAVRGYRLGRVRAMMQQMDIGALILSDPVNIRYATGARNMQVFSARNTPSRYCLVTQHRVTLFEFTGCEHLARGLETIDEVLPAMTASFVAAGPDIAQREKAWAREMKSLIDAEAGPGVRVGMERMNAGSAIALSELGVSLVDAQHPVELARCIKSAEEIKCAIASLRATEAGVAALREAIRPGITENALWSVLHQAIIERDGDYCETRLLNSGQRTNPWFQETGRKSLQPNELVALDTDVVGCHGYYSDFSRTFHVGPDQPSEEQRALYRLANEQVQHNISIIKPGMSFRDYAERAWDIPSRYHKNRYYLSAHGVGMTGEYPYLYHIHDFPDAGYDGEIQPGMTLCVESYIGADGGQEGVKLEEQLLVTETGTRLLSRFPLEEMLLAP
ncbi:aminopeptidase P family protein [Halomonas sp. ML-15]|uniref:M24 family metallopeptidase n=1 Tax=Halomonas sp. ML-15 TaxID=2773305 RepID=UPI0017468D6C|nr:Xaa-Pro peptidase family protein [Halomonas sp. ML-15]MBD3894548.1 aminopeptidase P family protein [Halomonas sp. ML-15]